MQDAQRSSIVDAMFRCKSRQFAALAPRRVEFAVATERGGEQRGARLLVIVGRNARDSSSGQSIARNLEQRIR
jgi:hypothetical protein